MARVTPVRISGAVFDAETKQPIPNFEVWSAPTYLQKFASGWAQSVGLVPELKTTGTNGAFSFLLVDGRLIESCDVEAKAAGYLPCRRTIIGPLTNNVVVTFAFKAVPDLVGNIKLPDGQPAAGTVLILCAQGARDLACMSLPGQFDLSLSRGNHTETDARGRFTLRGATSSGILFAAHKLGYAQLDLACQPASPSVTLQPWGRIAGVYNVGNRPSANRTVRLQNMIYGGVRPLLQAHLVARTDQEGNFVIEGVPPGEWKLSPHGGYLQVRAGETARIALGGDGSTIVGRLTKADLSAAGNYEGLVLTLSTQLPGLPQPTRSRFTSEAEYIAAKSEWAKRKCEFLASEPGRQALREYREYTVGIDQNGSFKVEEALPGIYELRLRTDALHQDPALMEALSDITKEVVIPEASLPGTPALDLGVLPLPTSRWTTRQDLVTPLR